jgi:hypothetical protein
LKRPAQKHPKLSGRAKLDETEKQALANEGYSSEDIHRAVFSSTPKRRSIDDLKAGIAERMRKKASRR